MSSEPRLPSSAEREIVVRARAVEKRFGNVMALQGFDLEVGRGECVGLLGPNGAGKSTFIGCLYGVVRRSEGDLTVFGLDPSRGSRGIKRRLGVVPQENALDEELTVIENMRIYARFEGLGRREALPRIASLLGQMNLEHKRDATIRTLSGGMKRRLAFVRALLSNPELLVLDEPTTGLDPAIRHLLWEKVLSFRQAGKTVLVTTHYMHEAELLCDRVVILNRGRAVADGAPRELIEKESPGYVAIYPLDQETRLREIVPAGWQIFQQGRQCCLRAPRLEDLTAFQRTTDSPALQLRPANLEDVYLKLTGRDLDDNE